MIFGIVAGEPSGDRLGAGLMQALKRDQPDCRFVGIGGPLMKAQGLECLVDMDRLSINGFAEPIKRLPELVSILRLLLRSFRQQPLSAFIGVDFNVFNFLLERLLKRRGIRTVHYVSPSVYAWRRGRVRSVARTTDLLLTLYPFEPAFYDNCAVQAEFVGHPLADEISPQAGSAEQQQHAQSELGITGAALCVAVLPGSRLSEARLMTGVFLEACSIVNATHPNTVFVVGCPREEIENLLHERLTQHPALNVVVYRGDARKALTACDVALVKSGTSTLEAMLLHRPMVVSYRLGELTFQLVKRLLRTPYVALPNILAGRELVPELLQHDATADALAANLLEQLDKYRREPEYLAAFNELHARLRCGADDRAAAAVLRWLAAAIDEKSEVK